MSGAYIRVKEVRGQVPGTICNGARTKSAINNYQAPGYVRAERERERESGAPGPRVELPSGIPGVPELNPRVAEDPLAVVLDQVRRH